MLSAVSGNGNGPETTGDTDDGWTGRSHRPVQS